MYLGKPGALQQIPDPNPGVTATPAKNGATHTTIGGYQRVDYAGATPRTWALSWGGGPRYLTDDQYDLLEQLFQSAGPLALLPYSSKGARWNYIKKGAEYGSFQSTAANTKGTLKTNNTFSGFATQPGLDWHFQLLASQTAGTGTTALVGIQWLDSAGANLSAQDGTAGSVSTNTALTVAATAPSGAAYGQPYLKVTNSGTITIAWSKALLELGTPSGTYRQPRGMPVVSFSELSHEYNFSFELSASATLLEVG